MHIKGVLKNENGAAVPDAVIMIKKAPFPVNDMAAVSNTDGSFSLSSIEAPARIILQIHAMNEIHIKEVSIGTDGLLNVII